MAATLLAASFAVFADYSYFGPRVLRCRHLTPSGCPASSSIAGIAGIIIVMTSTLLSAGSGRNPARDGPTPAASVKCVSLCVFFCVLKDFFLWSSGAGELWSWRAVELLDISCAYSLADEVAVSAYCFSAPGATPATDFDSFRFIFLCSLAAAAARPGQCGRAALSGLNYVYAPHPTEYLVLSVRNGRLFSPSGTYFAFHMASKFSSDFFLCFLFSLDLCSFFLCTQLLLCRLKHAQSKVFA